MKKQLRLIPALAFGMAILSISTLANAEVVVKLKEATLVAKGVGVAVSVQITCNPAFFGEGTQLSVSGTLVQRTTGNNSTDSSFFTYDPTWICTGSPQDFDVIMTVTSPKKPFKPGSALLSMGAVLYNFGTNQFDNGSFPLQEIQIRR